MEKRVPDSPAHRPGDCTIEPVARIMIEGRLSALPPLMQLHRLGMVGFSYPELNPHRKSRRPPKLYWDRRRRGNTVCSLSDLRSRCRTARGMFERRDAAGHGGRR
jgi:hypothetical protein